MPLSISGTEINKGLFDNVKVIRALINAKGFLFYEIIIGETIIFNVGYQEGVFDINYLKE